MKLLAIDIGNTSTSIGVYSGSRLGADWDHGTDKALTSAELEKLFRQQFEDNECSLSDIKSVIVSSVVPELDESISQMSKRLFGTDPLFVDHTNAGIKIDYPNPDEIGADRLVNSVAAYEKFRSSVIVVDFGTATTFDCIDSDGVYIGGVIAPGAVISNEALYGSTSKLPKTEICRTDCIIGKTTKDAIQSGVYHGYLGLVQGIIQKIKKEMNRSTHVVATGGLAGLMAEDLGIEADPLLTLDGLRIVYKKFILRQTLE